MSELTFDDILESALERAYDAGASHNNRILWEGLEALTSTTAARLRSLKVDPPSRIDVVRRFAAEERPLHVGVEWVRELAAEIDALTPPRPEPVAWDQERLLVILSEVVARWSMAGDDYRGRQAAYAWGVNALTLAHPRAGAGAEVIECDEWRVVTKEGRSAVAFGKEVWAQEEAERRNALEEWANTAPHRVMRVCLVPVEVDRG